MNANVNLERLANIFHMEMVSAEVNGEPAFALADIQDTDKILYGPVYDGDIVDQLKLSGIARPPSWLTGDLLQLPFFTLPLW